MELTCSTWGEKLKRKKKNVTTNWICANFACGSRLIPAPPPPLVLSSPPFPPNLLPSHYSLLSLWSPLFISSTIHLPPPRSCLLSITRLVSYSSISISLLHDFCKTLKSLVTFREHSQDNCLVKVCSVSPLREYPHFGLINKP